MPGEKTRGYVLGAVAAASYGLNPLFALPLYGAGLGPDSVLFYRYLLAVVMLGSLMIFRRQSFALTRRDILPLAVMGLLFSFSSLCLFASYNYMDAGIASTILFLYPVMVAVIMSACFGERVTASTVLSILLALGGIALLYKGGDGATLSLAGVALVFLSSLCYAVYIVGVNRSSLRDLSTEKLTFYSLLFGLSVYLVRLRGVAGLQMIPSPLLWINAVSLALFPTIVSLVTMAGAIRRIGSTPTAILGALEPVTALFFGVLVFGERLTPRILTGVALILAAVTLIIAGKSLRIPTAATHLAHWPSRPRLPHWTPAWLRRLPPPPPPHRATRKSGPLPGARPLSASGPPGQSHTLPRNFTMTVRCTGNSSAFAGLFLSNFSSHTFPALHPASAAANAVASPKTSNIPTASPIMIHLIY